MFFAIKVSEHSCLNFYTTPASFNASVQINEVEFEKLSCSSVGVD